MTQINKETVGRIEIALEAFSMSLTNLNEATEAMVTIFENAYEAAQMARLRVARSLTIEAIQLRVAKDLNLEVYDIRSDWRKRELAEARQIGMLLCRDLLDPADPKNTLKNIGAEFGGRDHSTVLYSCNTALDLIDTDPIFREKYLRIKSKLTTEDVENIATFETSDL